VFGIEGWKLGIILVAALLLIGPDKMPEIARTVGKFIRMFNAAKDEMERTIRADMFAGEQTTKVFTETGESLASSLYANTTEDDEEEEEE
jgi:Sec-independent protein translocase protein TatA